MSVVYFTLAGATTPAPTPIVGDWILETGFWADSGVRDDTDVRKDS